MRAHRHRPIRRTVAQRVVDQVAHQHRRARAVERHGGQVVGERQLQGLAVEAGRDFPHQGVEVGGRALQGRGAGGEALAFQQVGDQRAHQREVAQQSGALGGVAAQLGVEAGAGERRAKLVADGQQQRALAVQHALQAGGHVIDLLCEVAQLVSAANGNGRAEVAFAIALRALADVVERAEEPAHGGVGQEREQQQAGEWQQRTHRVPLVPDVGAHAEGDAVAVGGAAGEQAPAPVVVLHLALPFGVLARVRIPLHRGPLDAHRDRQLLDQRLRPRRVGRRADVGGQAVDVVGEQRFDEEFEAARQRRARAAHEHHHRAGREHQEERDQPPLQRMAEALVPARVGVHTLAPLHARGTPAKV